MKKTFFWLLLVTGLIVSFKIGRIFIYDFNRLTEYGFGYLTGLIIIFLLIMTVSILLGNKLYSKNHLS